MMRNFMILISCLMITSCIQGYGPAVRNGFDTDLSIIVEYNDETETSVNQLKPCVGFPTGKSNKPEEAVKLIKVFKDGKELYSINQINEMVLKHGDSWLLTPSGVQFEYIASEHCP